MVLPCEHVRSAADVSLGNARLSRADWHIAVLAVEAFIGLIERHSVSSKLLKTARSLFVLSFYHCLKFNYDLHISPIKCL